MFHVINKRALLVEVWCTLISLNFYLFQKNLQVLGAPNGFCCLKRFLLEALLVIRQVMPQVSHAAIHSKKGSYGHGRHEVIDGARDKTQVFRPNVRTCGLSEQMYCSTCDNVGNFWRFPQSFGARGTVTNLPHPPLRPWLQKIRIPTRRKYLYSMHCLCCTDAQTRHHCRYVFCLHQLLRGQPFDRRDKVFHKCGLGKIAWFCQACDMEMKSCMTLR